MTDYYCDFAPGHALHGPYHDREYGFPVADEAVLFERLILESNQAGLSWELMLKKRANFHAAFEGFEVDRVAAYGAAARACLPTPASSATGSRSMRRSRTRAASRRSEAAMAASPPGSRPITRGPRTTG